VIFETIVQFVVARSFPGSLQYTQPGQAPGVRTFAVTRLRTVTLTSKLPIQNTKNASDTSGLPY